MLGAYNLFYEY